MNYVRNYMETIKQQSSSKDKLNLQDTVETNKKLKWSCTGYLDHLEDNCLTDNMIDKMDFKQKVEKTGQDEMAGIDTEVAEKIRKVFIQSQ